MEPAKTPRKPLVFYFLIFMAAILAFNLLFMPMMNQTPETTYDDFLNKLENGQVVAVEVSSSSGEILFQTDEDGKTRIYSLGQMEDSTALTQRLEAYNSTVDSTEQRVRFGAVIPQQPGILTSLISWLLPIVVMLAGSYFLIRFMQKRIGGGNAMQFGKSNAKVYVAAQTGIRFSDVAGEDEAKEALQELVDFLHNPAKYKEIGAVMPKGALLVGPPGTGKTLLAKAVAGEAGVPFFSISGSEFVEMFVGMGAARVRDLFKQAQEKAPCIVFIDEIDAIGKKRDGGVIGGNDEREQTLNQLLTEMDGFASDNGVLILAATNRPESLDPALLRPGRFDRRVPVELPDLAGREAILRVHARDIKMAADVDLGKIARATAGASGAELANIVNESALHAVRVGRKSVVQADFEEAVETVIAGYQRKGAVIPAHQKQIVAYHEIGHALVAALQSHSAPVAKITIVPRTSGALGYTMQVEEEETVLMSREEAFNKIATLTGGRSAEELVFGSYTSGASNDIEQATKLARSMVTRLGMSDKFDMTALETVNNPYLGGDTTLACSQETAAEIDREVVSLIRKAHAKAQDILKQNREQLDRLAAYLLERETITGEEFMRILNETTPDKDKEEA